MILSNIIANNKGVDQTARMLLANPEDRFSRVKVHIKASELRFRCLYMILVLKKFFLRNFHQEKCILSLIIIVLLVA